ncbi:iron-sulfur cluster-binding domain-containing protein [Chryseobacterium piperi]|nr:iron-sulfur cluster-binding domain-containing protein [Chryseobacterium piperi]
MFPVKAICISVRKECIGVKTYRLKISVLPGDKICLLSGKYIEISYPDMEGKYKQRAYTISNNLGSEIIEISVKRTGNGGVSDAIHDFLCEGNSIDIVGQAGSIDINSLKEKDKKILMISNGIGITLPVALLREMTTGTHEYHSVNLISVAAKINEIPFLEEIYSMSKNNSWFDFMGFIIRDVLPVNMDCFSQGRPTRQEFINDPAPDLVIICGGYNFSTEMVEMVTDIYPNSRLLVEAFSNGIENTKTIDNLDKKCKLKILGSDETIDIDENLSLLENLEKNNIPIKNQCRSGLCRRCLIRIESGNVVRNPDFCTTVKERAEGLALACCTYGIGEDILINI